jgi:methionine-S-sulfoxide reductase
VLSTTVGYTGGRSNAPTYEEVCGGETGHVEAIQIVYDGALLKYERLVYVFLHMIEPSRADGQFCDVGSQYRPVIFYHSPEQKRIAEEALTALKKNMDVAVKVLPAAPFYPAEEYHQKFYQKQTAHYERYRKGSGRN